MSNNEAEDYTSLSFYRKVNFYHGTSHKNADLIATCGVDISKNKLGIYAQGFYLTNDKVIATEYADFDYPALLKVKILVKNPKIFLDDRDAEKYFRSYQVNLASDRQKTNLLKLLGYDAVEVKALNYFVVFEQKQIAVFKVEKL
jgi:ADP-Ribosyltransferase in polyvalent proteins